MGEADGDGEGAGMMIDVSDWLDVIMPSTALIPLITNVPLGDSFDVRRGNKDIFYGQVSGCKSGKVMVWVDNRHMCTTQSVVK